MILADRVDAGKKLAVALQEYRGNADVVLALPRGGVVTAAPVAKFLGVPLDLVLTRKIGHPHSPEYSIGAVGESGVLISKGECALVDQNWYQKEIERQRKELVRLRHTYLINRPSVPLKNRVVVIVDDGAATGHSALAAIEYVKKHQAKLVIFAVPVISSDVAVCLEDKVHKMVALDRPEEMNAVSEHYVSFPEVEDREVVKILDVHVNNSV